MDADGVVVGSALVAALAEVNDVRSARERAEAFLAPLRQALDQDENRASLPALED